MYIANVGSAVSSLIIGAAYPIRCGAAAAVAAVVHLIGTTQAAPAGLSVLKIPPEDEALLTKAFDKFSWWSYVSLHRWSGYVRRNDAGACLYSLTSCKFPISRLK